MGILILKRIPQDRKTYGGFVWPSGIGTEVECSDWNDEPNVAVVCTDGHGDGV